MVHSNAGNRLDRLPISSFHKWTVVAVAFAYFFEFADVNTFSVVAPQLVKHWGISMNTIAYITSISFLGMFIGSIIGGWIADKYGRKRGLLITVLFFSVFSLLNAVAWNPLSLGLFRLLTGMGLSAMTIVANTYISEVFPGKVRGKYLAYAMVIGICGTPATTWVARFLIPITDWSWRLVFVWGSIGILFLVFLPKLLESPRWLESRGDFDKADGVLKKLEAQATAQHGALPIPTEYKEEVKATKKIPVADLFKGQYLRNTVVLSILWICQTIGFFGYSTWAPTLLAQHGFTVEKSLTYVALSALGAPVGSFLASLISDRFERRWTLTVFGALIALSGLLYGVTFNPTFIVVFGLMVNIFERAYTSFAYAYSPELFPTEARATGTSIPYGLGRLSNLIGPIIISSLFTGYGYASVFYFIAGTWLVGAIVLGLFGQNTKKKESAGILHSAA